MLPTVTADRSGSSSFSAGLATVGFLSPWHPTKLAKSGTLSSEGPDDFVSKVNRYFQKNYKNSKLPTYMKKDSDSKKTFAVAVIFDGKELAEASAPSLKQAKQLAAEKVCKQFGIQ